MTPTGWIIAVIAVVLAAALGAATVQTLRLRAANADIERITGERDSALAANGELVRDTEKAAAAARAHQVALESARAYYERRLADVHKIDDDGCLDRVLPVDVRRLLTDGDPGTGENACPAGAGEPLRSGIPR